MNAQATGQRESECVDVSVELLAPLFWAFVSTTQADASESEDFYDKRLQAECLTCGMQVSGGELWRIATGDPEDFRHNPILTRLLAKQCPRHSCNGQFYQVRMSGLVENELVKIQDYLQKAISASEEEPSRAAIPRRLLRKRVLYAVSSLCFSVVLFFLLRHLIYGYPIPLIQKEQRYELQQGSDEP